MQHHSQTDVQVGTMNILNECAVVQNNILSAVLFIAFLLANSALNHTLIATTSVPTSLQCLLGYICT
jgi:hypothetical protein